MALGARARRSRKGTSRRTPADVTMRCRYIAAMDDNRSSSRDGFNRILGLASYALGVVLAGVALFTIYEEGFGDLYGLSIFGVVILICFAIGFTTARKK
jgi:hypothetical protein